MNIGADGMKTGFTNEAGYGLVGSAVQNGMRLIVVVNGLKSAKERADEARKLLNYGFNGFEQRLLFAEGQQIGDARMFGGEQGYVPLRPSASKRVRLMVPQNSSDRILARMVYHGPDPRAGRSRASRSRRLKVWRGDNVALEVPLQTVQAVEAGPLHRRAFDAMSELFGGWFRSGLKKL